MEVAIYGTYQNLLQILLCLVTVSASVFQHTEGRKTFNPNTDSISESGVVHPPEVNFHIKRKDSSIENLRLVRRDNIDINSPLCSVQNGEIYCQRGNNKAVAFYHAKDKTGAFAIKVEQENNGKHRRKLDGVLVRDNNALFIEPASPLSRLLGKEHPHRITKRSSSFIATSSSVHIFGRELVNIAEAPHFISDFTFDPPSKEHHDYVVEVLVMIDYSLYKKFLEKSFNNRDEALTQIRYYFAHIVNGMDLRYTSINNTDYSIAIRLTGFFVAKNESDLPFVLTYKQGTDERFKIDGSSTLLGLTNFLTRSKNLPHYDHAMLFTEHDATNGRGHILGTSYLSGICTTMSTSIIVDHGSYNSAGIAAHELGHNLGVIYHDGDTTVDTINCPKELNYIMAPSSAIISSKTKEFSFRFSDCSITQIHRQLRNLSKKKKNCLASEKGPSLESVVVQPYLMIPPGQIEDVHSQCREIYGNESFMCPPSSIEEMCYKMYCYDPFRKICITASEQRAAMGSSCGFKKWCKLGKCVVDDKAPPVPEDCPFPDVPASRTNCAEEASPFRCRDENFYRRCCQSCNKNFTASDLCKDMKIRINGLDCSAFTLKYGTAICELDHNIRNFCCKSCSQTQEAPATPSPDINLMSVSSSCNDNAYVRINGMECRDFVNQYGVQVCARDMVSTHCCGSCLSLQR